DGIVGPGDYEVWRSNFGAAAAATGTSQKGIVQSATSPASSASIDGSVLPIDTGLPAAFAQQLHADAKLIPEPAPQLIVAMAGAQSPIAQKASELLLVRGSNAPSEKASTDSASSFQPGRSTPENAGQTDDFGGDRVLQR